MTQKSTELIERLRVLGGNTPELQGLEFAVKKVKTRLFRAASQTLEFQKEAEEYSILIRMLKNKRLAQVVGNDSTRDGLRALYYKCLDLLKFSPEKPHVEICAFLYNDKVRETNLKDSALELIREDEKIRRLFNLEKKILQNDPRLTVQNCFYSETLEETSHWTKGSPSPLTHSFSNIEIGAQVLAKSGDQIALASATDQQANYYALDWARVAQRSAGRALARLDSTPLSSGNYDVLFSNRIASRLLCSFFEALRADNVLHNKSFLGGLFQQKIFPDSLNVIDDPHLRSLPGSQFWDDEGVPTARTLFIQNGRVINFAHRQKTAKDMGVAPTGHARLNFENGAMSIGAHNLYIEPTHRDHVDLLSFVNGGLYLVEPEAPLSFSTKSGDFYLRTRGYSVADGKPQKPLHGAVIRGNFVDLFSKMTEVGRNLRWGRHYGAPSFMVESIRVEEAT